MKYLQILLLICTVNVTSQNIELTWAEKIKTKKQIFVLGGQPGSYFTGHIDKDDHLVCRKYNDKMEMVKEQAVPFELDDKRYVYQGTLFIKQKMIHLIRENRRKEDKSYLLAAFTDLDLKNSDKTIILDEVSDKELTGTFGSNTISPDSTKVLVYHEIKVKKKETSRLSLKVYDASFTDLMLDKVVEIPIRDKNFVTTSLSVDNFGNVYVLAQITRENKEREKGQSKTYYKMIVFDKSTGKPKEFDFDFENQTITSIDIIPSKNNTLICTGFVSDIESSFLSKKVSRVSDEMFSTIIDCNTISIASKFITKVDGLYPEKMKKSQDFVPYKVRDIFPKKEGGYVVVAEQYKLIIITSTSPNGGTHTTYKYYYCDIACLHVDTKGNLESMTKIPKYQLNASNPSIISTYVNGTTYIVYEDLTKNLDAFTDNEEKRSTKSMFTSDSKNSLFLLTIAADGKPKKEIIYDYKDSKIRPNTLSSKLIDDNTIILRADDQIGKLQF